tara:strand:+ start:1669 stop:4170 length:2502 start_codon:yes stop_codon:yes gene_type:complete
MNNFTKFLYAVLIIVVFTTATLFGQSSYLAVEAQFDSYGPQESYFYISDSNSDTLYYFQPTQVNELLIDTILLDAGSYNLVMFDAWGDGWVDSGIVGYINLLNHCEGQILNIPADFAFGVYTQTFNIGPCNPNAPPPPPPLCENATIIINVDQYPGETTWEIADTLGNVLFQGGPYAAPAYQPQSVDLCLPVIPLEFTINDAYGDGLQGSLWGGNDGSYYVVQCTDTLIFGTDPAFENDTTHFFQSDTCAPPPPVIGCMDWNYLEYNPLAVIDDGSCLTPVVWGCTDSTAFNYVDSANTDVYINDCDYTLNLTDLGGNGWAGSTLVVEQGYDLIGIFFLPMGMSDTSFVFNLGAPEAVRVQFVTTTQSDGTANQCGFSLVSASGDTTLYYPGGFQFQQQIPPFMWITAVTDCGNECIPRTYGCIDSLAVNYDPTKNTNDGSCYYNPGCMNPLYLEYDALYDYDDGSCLTLAVYGCMDSTALNYNPAANIEIAGSCIDVIEGCTDSTMFNYNVNANVDDGNCIPIIEGCIDPTAFNFNPLANTDDGTCTPVVWGCTDPVAFNYNVLANTDDNSCIPVVFGCTDASMWNYDANANTNNGSCIPYIYGCTDSTMYNYNATANTDNGTCEPFVYGCTDAAALNFDPLANTLNNTCCYISGCTDSTALNYNSNACYDDNSCIEIIEGCTDISAINYNILANVSDSSCYYTAGCAVGDVYYLPNECFAWVIDIDSYCCDIDWDSSCDGLYQYCIDGWTGPVNIEELRENELLIYPNPTKDVINITAHSIVDVIVYNMTGKKLLDLKNVKRIDLSSYPKGIYNLQIIYKEKQINNKIIKN